jgi:FAD/FMN-containing dehydrogenase
MIDLSRMKSIRVDPLRRTARAEPGVKLGEFDHETQAFSLATTAGVVSDTGIAGLTLGGGIGWLARKYGLSSDNLLSVDVVTADGRFLTASATEHADLFWGVRGGGGNFGIITSFEYRLHPVGPMVLGGFVTHPVSKAKEVLKVYAEFSGSAPDELTTMAVLSYSPEGEPVVSIGGCYHGPLDVGEQVIRPLKGYGPPIADLLGPMPYTAVQRMLDRVAPPGWRYYLKTGFINDLGGDAMDILAGHFPTVPSRLSLILIFQLGGAISRVPQDQTAWFHREASYQFEVISVWQDPADDEKNVRWAREVWDAFRPFTSGGVSVNHLGDEGEERVLAAYGADTYHRLASLKKMYDPTNMFRLNQNIKPTA